MPYFFIAPTGGWWYTNNAFTSPEYYIFFEVISVVEHAMGSQVTRDAQKRMLVGHSMGGYGAIMNSMRTNMEFFGAACGLSGALYIWDLPEFQESVARDVLQEAVDRKAGPFQNCSYTQPPYRYYGDDINFKTLIATSLATVFHADGSTSRSNNPYCRIPYSSECTDYYQSFGFKFWLSDTGVLDRSMFSMAPWNSPNGFLQLHYPSLQKSLNKNIFLSVTRQDDVVDYLENVKFSQALRNLSIDHTFYLYNGSHTDVTPGILQCIATFKDRMCATSPDIKPSFSLTDPLIPAWGLIVACGVAIFAVVGFVWMTIVYRKKQREGYESVGSDFPAERRF